MKKKIISIAMSLVMAISIMTVNGTEARADEVTSNGLAISATNSEDVLVEGIDFAYSNGKWTISTTKPITISMKSGIAVTDDYIVIDTTNGAANVTLDGINIKTDQSTIVEVGGDNATTITVKGQNSIVSTSTSNAEGIYSQSSPLRITGTEAGQLSFSGTYSAIEGYKAGIELDGNWKLKVTDATFGVFLSPYSSSSNILNISDNVSIEMSEIDEHAIYNKYGKINMKADDGEHIVINTTTDAWCIYGHGIDMAGKITITAKSTADDGAIYSGGDDNPINISGDIAIDIESVKNGLTGKGNISIEDAKIDIVCTNTYAYGINCNNLTIVDSIIDIESTGYAAITADAVTIAGDTKLNTSTEVDTTSSRYGIMFEGTLNVTDNAEVKVEVSGKKTYALYGSSANKSDTIQVKDSAKLVLDGGVRTVYYAENVTVTDDAEFTIKNAEEYGIYNGDLQASGNAKVSIESAEYGVRPEEVLTISNNAEVLIAGEDKAIYSSRKYQVTPNTGKAYEVSVGKMKDTAELTTYYEASGEQSTKSGMKYFHAVSKTPYATTNIAVDYRNETLTGFKINAKYTVNDVDVTPQNGILTINEEWFETTVKISQKGDESYTASKPQEIAIPARPNAPAISGEYKVSDKDKTKFVYTVNPVENAEYKMDDGEWQDSNVFDEILPLSKHTFSVRKKATNTSFASEVTRGEECTFVKLNGEASVAIEDWIFGNTGNNPMPSSKTNGIDKVVYLYKLSSADDSAYSNIKPADAGIYTVKATFAATETYNEVVATTEFTIKKADKVVGEITSVDDITDKNVKVEDKKKLEEAKAELEKNLEQNKNNYTDDVKNSIQKEMKRIEELLNLIKKMETASQSPTTGDVASIWMWMAVVLLSGIVVIVVVDNKKRLKQ